MTRKTNATRNFPLVLKTIISDVHASNKSFTLNDKQIRSRLRAKLNDAHIRNTSWVANNQREYDAIRSAFDAAYATSIAKPARVRRAKSTTTADA